jgi:hypothetical protein
LISNPNPRFSGFGQFGCNLAIEGISGFRPPQGDNITPRLFLKGGGCVFHENHFDAELKGCGTHS